MKYSRLLYMVRTLSLFLIFCFGDVGAATLDQSFEPEFKGTSGPASSSVFWAQTFTVGLTGTLAQVDVLLSLKAPEILPPGSEINLEIRSTTSGIPDNGDSSILARVHIPRESIGYYESFIPVDILSTELTANTGDVLAIVLGAPGFDLPGISLNWWGNSQNEYTPGSVFILNVFEGSEKWVLVNSGSVDFGFRTYMQTSPIPPPPISGCEQSDLSGTWMAYGVTGDTFNKAMPETARCKIKVNSSGSIVGSGSYCKFRSRSGVDKLNVGGGHIGVTSKCVLTGDLQFCSDGVCVEMVMEHGTLSTEKDVLSISGYLRIDPDLVVSLTGLRR